MKLICVILIILTIISCNTRVEKEKLPGVYIFSDLRGDTLKLKSDGTFYHHTLKEGKIFKNSGTWKLNSLGNEIIFENFSFLTD